MPNLPIAGGLCLSVVWHFSTGKKKNSSVKSQRGYDLMNEARKLWTSIGEVTDRLLRLCLALMYTVTSCLSNAVSRVNVYKVTEAF